MILKKGKNLREKRKRRKKNGGKIYAYGEKTPIKQLIQKNANNKHTEMNANYLQLIQNM